ncbi:MAG: fluoride efflux transporter CrcB [Nitrospira sp.]|nr:fluoride efflux transporter CrcB [Nitrospira sp.]MCP9461017.1 fluoride efflux transporter CrcB [Nitrospira sp.]MCP9475307.1 fluoride efflux transporter CrcB [Nitrospira sp.]
MIKLLLIGTGGFVGSILRYLISGAVQTASQSIAFPYGTLAVNVIGCVLIGFFFELAEGRGLFSPDARAFLIVGILGGFTTFSTFGNETMNLLRDGEWALALLNVGAQVVLGIGGVWIGYILAYQIWR